MTPLASDEQIVPGRDAMAKWRRLLQAGKHAYLLLTKHLIRELRLLCERGILLLGIENIGERSLLLHFPLYVGPAVVAGSPRFAEPHPVVPVPADAIELALEIIDLRLEGVDIGVRWLTFDLEHLTNGAREKSERA